MNSSNLRNLSLWQIILLSLTYAAGMGLSLYVKLPQKITGAFWHTFGSWILGLHIILGFAALAIAVMMMVKSLKERDSRMARYSRAGLGSLVFAFIAGFLFLIYPNEIYSYIMALAFLGALFHYVLMYSALK